ncbi:MAG TPA: exosortase H-associated membrane protein [Thermodesulfobacteriota bacterium]|nr:exosortase H-associated membrane protein [Thermodesulfobacteriota bacterium]
MDKENKKPLFRSALIKASIIFIAAYVISLLVWLGVKSYYGMAITTIASHALTLFKNVDVVSILRKGDLISVGFIPQKYGVAILKTTIEVPISNYTFNAPLTFAIMAAFYPFLKRKWIYLEAILILLVVHFLFVFSMEGEKLSAALETQGYEKGGAVSQIFWEFLWGFINNMVVRFEPFLIGAYLYFFRNRTSPVKAAPKKSKK